MKITLRQDQEDEIKVHQVLETAFSVCWGWDAGWCTRQLLLADQYPDGRVASAEESGYLVSDCWFYCLLTICHRTIFLTFGNLSFHMWPNENTEQCYLLKLMKELSEMLDIIHLAWFLAKAYKVLLWLCICCDTVTMDRAKPLFSYLDTIFFLPGK